MVDELRQVLRELATSEQATQVAILHPASQDADDEGDPESSSTQSSSAHKPQPGARVMTAPIGGGAVLSAVFAAPEHRVDPNGRAAALERAARQLRACARRWEVATLPPVVWPEAKTSPRERIFERIETYLRALVGSVGMDNAAVTLRGRLLASAAPLGELHRAQLPFTVRRLAAEVDHKRGDSSHAELFGDDFYATSFWYGGGLIGFFEGPYALDFVRHRSKQVTRELSHLLELLEEPPTEPVQTAPRPS